MVNPAVVDTFVPSFLDILFFSHAFYFFTCSTLIAFPMVVLNMIFSMFLLPLGSVFSIAVATALAFAARSASSISSSPILHDIDKEPFALIFTDDLNRSKNDSMGALNGTGVGILPLGPKSCPNFLPTVGISFVSAKKKSYLLIIFFDFFLSALNFVSSFSSITMSAFAFFALIPISPDAMIHTEAGLVVFLGS
uniref:Uncharacterized protein n=1 Tax=uncultured marine crenarchaeote HF4000_ANIW141M18 TaxID=455579 RepID=B3T611_9ARCH|nr:hypothetical protein ALOHA_HF4000ANIW141M18ctg4g21 [uncultured marine crenarchaeote HF4000_ANIW141M18]